MGAAPRWLALRIVTHRIGNEWTPYCLVWMPAVPDRQALCAIARSASGALGVRWRTDEARLSGFKWTVSATDGGVRNRTL